MPDGRKLVPVDELFSLVDLAKKQPVTVDLPTRVLLALLEHIDVLGEALDIEAGDYCRVCGCTQNNSCEGRCAWAEEGLCTACAELLDEEEEARLGPCPSCKGDGDRGEPEPWCSTCDGTGKAPQPEGVTDDGRELGAENFDCDGDGEGDVYPGLVLAQLGDELVGAMALGAPTAVTDAVLAHEWDHGTCSACGCADHDFDRRNAACVPPAFYTGGEVPLDVAMPAGLPTIGNPAPALVSDEGMAWLRGERGLYTVDASGVAPLWCETYRVWACSCRWESP